MSTNSSFPLEAAESIGITSGLLALATFAFQSSLSLYQIIQSLRSYQRVIRELKQELKTLHGGLHSLQQAVTNDSADLASLELPLLCCGKACKDLEVVIMKRTANPSESRTSIREWAAWKYMGNDIAKFTALLAVYKSTISIALADANLYTL